MVETGGLENRWARKGPGGSNPPSSAIQSAQLVSPQPLAQYVRNPRRNLSDLFGRGQGRIDFHVGRLLGRSFSPQLRSGGPVPKSLTIMTKEAPSQHHNARRD